VSYFVALLKWLAYGAVFFACFAFAVNNLHDTTVKLFFGSQFRVPVVLIVLGAFAAGLLAGMVAMLPRWWLLRRRRHGT
jgi:lipopolysaccharide assembly protein A